MSHDPNAPPPVGQDPITRAAKLSIFIMTPMIVIGVLVMIGTIVFRLSDGGEGVALNTLVIERGAEVHSAIESDGTLQVVLTRADGVQVLKVFNAKDGALLRETVFETQ